MSSNPNKNTVTHVLRIKVLPMSPNGQIAAPFRATEGQ